MTKDELIAKTRNALDERRDRSAWDRGVTRFAHDIIETILESSCTMEDLRTVRGIDDILRNGARDWTRYSWDGCYLIYDGDIAENLCTPSELKRTRNGERRPNSREEWLDVQARALAQAATRAAQLIIKIVKEK